MPTVAQEIFEIKKKVAELEYQTNYLFERLSIEMPEAPVYGLTPEIMYLVQRGDRNQARKRYMEETGVGLREAKEFIDSIKL